MSSPGSWPHNQREVALVAAGLVARRAHSSYSRAPEISGEPTTAGCTSDFACARPPSFVAGFSGAEFFDILFGTLRCAESCTCGSRTQILLAVGSGCDFSTEAARSVGKH